MSAIGWRRGVLWLFVLASFPLLAQDKGPPLLERMKADAFDLPEHGREGKPLRIWATTYRIYTARESAGGLPLLDPEGKPISPPIAPNDFCRGAVQGGIRVLARSGEGTLYTFSSAAGEAQVDCSEHIRRKAAWVDAVGRSRFKRTRTPFGVGSGNEALVPLRSIAVDKDVVPLGSVLYIPAARGVKVRGIDGKTLVHDGYFYAADTGGAVRGHQVDVFLGFARGNPFPSFIRHSARHGRFDAFFVDDPAIVRRLKALHADA